MNAPSTQKHLGSNRTSMGQRVVSRTFKIIQWLVNSELREIRTMSINRLYFENCCPSLRVQFFTAASEQGKSIVAYLQDKATLKLAYVIEKMPCGTYQTHNDSEVRNSSRSLRSSSQEADFEGIWCESWKNLSLHRIIYSLTVITASSQETATVCYQQGNTGKPFNGSKASKAQQILAQEGFPSKASRIPGG